MTKRDWATVDKRIRKRKRDFSNDEVAKIGAKLMELPDLVESVEVIDVVQPAVAPPPEEEAEAEAEAEVVADEPN